MKKVIITLTVLIATAAAYGQGTLQFNNLIVGTVDARVFMPDNRTGVGAGFTAQLFVGTDSSKLTAVTPTTDFRTTSAAAAGYVNPVDVTVPGIPGGTKVFVEMIIWDATLVGNLAGEVGRSNPITVTLGGGGFPPTPAAPLAGLNSFVLSLPEPSTIALGAFGVAALLLRRRK